MKLCPRYIRITDKGRDLIHGEWIDAHNRCCSERFRWFSEEIWDYRESCRRNFGPMTWRLKLACLLLKVVDRLMGR